MTHEAVFVLLFAIAAAVALLARRINAPYTVALVVAGVVLGSVGAFEPPHLTKQLLYTIFLPGLLFEAAFHIEFDQFKRNKLAIVTLAVPGVLVAMGLTAGMLAPAAAWLRFDAGFGFIHALVFAALIAATDPIAVVAMFKTLGAPKRLSVLVEGESLLNDGTAVVFFTLVLGFMEGREASAAGATIDFVKIVGMGALIGAVLALAVSAVIRRVDDAMIEITLTTIVAYGSFTAAEQFHFSGVIATVVAGVILGDHVRRRAMSPSSRVAVESFWEYVAFALNSVVFLLIGFQVHIEELASSWKSIVVAYVAVMLARAAAVAIVSAILGRTRERIPWSWAVVMTWGGLRGALSMVLVLALPDDFPHRHTLVTMTFGVVLISLLLQGLTMGPLLQRFGIVSASMEREAYERLLLGKRAATAAIKALDDMVAHGRVHEEVASTIRSKYREVVTSAENALRDIHLGTPDLVDEELSGLQRERLMVEKDAVLDEQRQGLVGASVVEHQLRDIDVRLGNLETNGPSRPPTP